MLNILFACTILVSCQSRILFPTSGIIAKVCDGIWMRLAEVRDSITMAEYDEGFDDKKPTEVERYKVTCSMDSITICMFCL